MNANNNYGTFDQVKEEIILFIQKSHDKGNDLARAIEEMKHPLWIDGKTDKPTLKRWSGTSPADTDPDYGDKLAEKETFNEQSAIEFKQEFGFCQKRIETFKENKNKIFSRIQQNYCTDRMRERIKTDSTFSKLDNDPIKLLELIRALMFDSTRGKCRCVTIAKAIMNLMNCKQQEGESLSAFTERFKPQKNAVKQGMGTKMLCGFLEQTEDCKKLTDRDEKKAFLENSHEEWSSYLFVMGADNHLYKNHKTKLAEDYAMGHNKHPTTMDKALDGLTGHVWDNDPKKRKSKKDKNNFKKEEGTDATDASNVTATSFAQGQGRQGGGNKRKCFVCGDEEHVATDCNIREEIPRNQWFDRTGKVPQVVTVSNATTDNSSNNENSNDTSSVTSSVT